MYSSGNVYIKRIILISKFKFSFGKFNVALTLIFFSMYRNLIEHILITDKIYLESFFITNTVSKRSMNSLGSSTIANLKNSSPSINDDRNENKNYIFIFLTTGKRGTEEEISQSRREGGRG